MPKRLTFPQFYAEKLATMILPAHALTYVLPFRFRFAVRIHERGSHAKMVRYLKLATERREDLRELFRLGLQSPDLNGADKPLTEHLSDDALKRLLSWKPEALLGAIKDMSDIGLLRVAAVFRAIVLLRSTLDYFASENGHRKSFEAMILEIIESDVCKAIIDRPEVIKANRDILLSEIQDARKWSFERKMSVFVGESVYATYQNERPLRDKSIKIQGPSNRASDVSNVDTDLIGVVGYSGPGSLVAPVKQVDVSIYFLHKLRTLQQEGRLDILDDVGLAVFPHRLRDVAEVAEAASNYNCVFSNIQGETGNSRFNAGVHLFLWVLAAGASRVVVTNFDMFINANYPKGYIAFGSKNRSAGREDSWQLDTGARMTGFATHNPSQQYAIYKCFRGYDNVKYDSFLDEIVSHPLSAYLTELERLYRIVDR